jgi:hypothetical protein
MADVSAIDWMLQNIIFTEVPHGRGSKKQSDDNKELPNGSIREVW